MEGTPEEQGPPPPRPQFFKILLPGFSHRMTIPQAFNQYIVGEMQEKATIVSPLGKSWRVGVHRQANLFFFGEGWQGFSEAHGLGVGCFLVFRYEGGMVFTVTVFDTTTCMREYGPAEGGNVEINTSKSPGGQTYLLSTDSHNHNLSLGGACTEGSWLGIKISSCKPCEEPNLPLPREFVEYVSEDDSRLATIVSPIGKAWHVKVHKDSKGFHFADGWQRFAVAHNLRRGDSLLFKHKGNLIFDVAIFDDDNCETELNLDVATGVVNGLEKLPTFMCGKRVAAAKMEPPTGEHQSVEMEEVTEDQNGEGLDGVDAMHGTARRPHFEVIINLSKQRHRYALRIPAGFRTPNQLSGTNCWFLRDPNGQLWPVRLSHGIRSRQKIHAGWRDFCVGNNLRDGDVCLFELKQNNEFHVKIHRKQYLKLLKVSMDTKGKPKRSLCGQAAAELVKSGTYHRPRRSARINQDQKVPKLMNSCASRPQFTSIITQSAVFGKAYLNIPTSFLSSVDLSSIRRVILLDPDARQWPVNVYQWKANMTHKAAMGYGWKAFCTSNNVEVGDKCIFKLASKRKNDVFHVRLIKQ